MIDVHRREPALVLVRIPERKLLAAVRRAECVIDIEDRLFTRRHRRAELINKGTGEPGRIGLLRRVLQTWDRRL